MTTKQARLLVVGSSCYDNQTCKVACNGEQLLRQPNQQGCLKWGAAAMTTNPARSLLVGSSCYVNQTSKVACSGEQLLCQPNQQGCL